VTVVEAAGLLRTVVALFMYQVATCPDDVLS
jgi:hypothetical protein